MATDTKTKLLDHASDFMQKRGYNGFSFKDLAEVTGIRTASIHYHFPTKTILGSKVVDRYTVDFLEALGPTDIETPAKRLESYIALFRGELQKGHMCLCGIIGAEVGSVPEELHAGVRIFFDKNEKWLIQVFQRTGQSAAKAQINARLSLSALEGAMIIVRTNDDPTLFENIAQAVLSLASEK